MVQNTIYENEGMAWGTKIPGAYGKLFLTLFRVCAVGGIGYWLWDATDNIALIISCFYRFNFAGALGNIIDSVFTDF
jgi:signal peptidase II